MKLAKYAVSFALTLTSLSAAHAALPEGSFRGESPATKFRLFKNNGADAMVLLIRKDPSIAERYYGVLAHYDRIVGTNFTGTTAVVKWVPRMWIYQFDKRSDMNYKASILSVASNGNLEVAPNAHVDDLVLKKDGELDGAKLYLRGEDEEVVKFGGTVISTWEKMVPGKYFRSVDPSGKDYFKKEAVNTIVGKDGVVNFKMNDLVGKYTLTEKLPGLFTFTNPDSVKNDKFGAASKIAVFIDIMNWKKIAGVKTPFQTNEMMVADPANPSNVGFFYERVFGDKNKKK